MKRFIFVLILTIFPALTYAGWWRTYGGEYHDEGIAVEQIEDENYLVIGSWRGDPWLLETDNLGYLLWSRHYDIKDRIEYGERTSDGGCILTGVRIQSGRFAETWLLKTDSMGDSLWTKTYSPCLDQNIICIHQTLDEGYIVTGLIGTNDPWIGWSGLWLFKTDSEGDILWEQIYGPEGEDDQFTGFFVRRTNNGEYIVLGHQFIVQYGGDFHALWFFKTDSEGDTLWNRLYEGKFGHFFEETSDGGYIICGDSGLIKTDSLGYILWERDYGEEIERVRQTSDQGYITVSTIENPGYGHDLLLLKTDSLGDTIWTRTYGGDESDYGYDVGQTSDGGFIITGSTSSFGHDDRDLWLLKTDSLGLLAVEEPTTNPVTRIDWCISVSVGHQIVLRYEDRSLGFHASVFNASGRKVDELHSTQQAGTILWGQGFSPGVYFIKEATGSPGATRKVVLIK